MYAGFNVKVDETNHPFLAEDYGYEDILRVQKEHIRESLHSFVDKDGSLGAKQLQEEWFPLIKADVFISHAHLNEKLAIKFANWLFKNFGLVAFVDSCVWGYADELLRELDNRFCYQDKSNTYNYFLRNQTTSHVHMILVTSILQMMDKCEAIMFLNTPDSVSKNDYLNPTSSKTYSPWIYSEIIFTKYLRKKLRRGKKLNKGLNRTYDDKMKNVSVNYELNTEHMYDINRNDLILWRDSSIKSEGPAECLDSLYKMVDLRSREVGSIRLTKYSNSEEV